MISGSLPTDFWNVAAVPAKPPWMLAGMWISPPTRAIAAVASDSDLPCGRLNEIVLATNESW